MARVLVTGANGFAGRWLVSELGASGHEPVAFPSGADVRDADAVGSAVAESRPDAIAHLAAISFAPDAARSPGDAFAVAIGGTLNVLQAAAALQSPAAVLITGSSEVYGAPRPEDLPLTEQSVLRPRTPYALSKLAQESVALAVGGRLGIRVVVTRSFNHIGPGQRPDFVVAALAQRVQAVADGRADAIRVGNVEVRRDLTDVRDVVRAYRLLIEAMLDGRVGSRDRNSVLNVCSGRSVRIRDVAKRFAELADVEPRFSIDPSLVRASDPEEIRGDYSLLASTTGWHPMINVDGTLREISEDMRSGGDS